MQPSTSVLQHRNVRAQPIKILKFLPQAHKIQPIIQTLPINDDKTSQSFDRTFR